VDPFPLAGVLRRIRRIGDWSQRELAERIGTSKAAVAAAENGTRDLPVSLLARAAAGAGGRLVVVDAGGHELTPMDPGAVRDAGHRRFPAHLDTRYSDEGWWHGPHRYSRRTATYTFDRRRESRDGVRRFTGVVPEDHLRPQPGDSPAERATDRRRAAWGRQDEERRRHLEVVGSTEPDWGTGCTCPAGCELTEERNEDLSHASGCVCRCDVC
jgi:transcriptional regulator with XRE-family HTH domain